MFAEEVQHLVRKMLFPCLQAGLVSSFRLNHAGEGAVFPATRPGFPVLPNNGSKVNKAATGSRPETSFVVSPVETGKLKQRGDSRRVEMRKLTAINEKLRAAVEEYEDKMIEGYPDQEIANINKFMDNLVTLPRVPAEGPQMIHRHNHNPW